MGVMATLRVLPAVLSAGFNLVPFYGIYAWGWDAFELLLLYWAETVILFACTLIHIALIPTPRLGTMLVNGRTIAASHRMLIGFSALTAGLFIVGHLLFLCVLFSDDWFGRFHGVSDFVYTFFVASGIWEPLLLAALAGIIDVLIGEFHPAFIDALARRLHLALKRRQPPAADAFGNIVGGLYVRILITQAAVIFGAMASRRYGTMAPLAIIIGFKTLIDLGARLSAISRPSSVSPPSASGHVPAPSSSEQAS